MGINHPCRVSSVVEQLVVNRQDAKKAASTRVSGALGDASKAAAWFDSCTRLHLFALAFALIFAGCGQPYGDDYPCTASYSRWGAHVGLDDTCYAYRATCDPTSTRLAGLRCWP